MEFIPNAKGFSEMRNMPGVQQVCLEKARSVASIATAAIGHAVSCDVQPGRTRCHARASIDVPFEKGYYEKNAPNINAELAKAAKAVGGSSV